MSNDIRLTLERSDDMFRLPDILREEFEARIEYKQYISPEETCNKLLPYLIEDNGYNKFAMQMFIST